MLIYVHRRSPLSIKSGYLSALVFLFLFIIPCIIPHSCFYEVSSSSVIPCHHICVSVRRNIVEPSCKIILLIRISKPWRTAIARWTFLTPMILPSRNIPTKSTPHRTVKLSSGYPSRTLRTLGFITFLHGAMWRTMRESWTPAGPESSEAY